MDFYYPVIINKKECRGCKDCVNSCPVEALSYDGDDLQVDREKCKNYQEKLKDVCMNCVEFCRKNVIQLKEEP